MDRVKSKKLVVADFRGLSFDELKALVDSQPESLFSKLFYMMIKTFSTTKADFGMEYEILVDGLNGLGWFGNSEEIFRSATCVGITPIG